MDAATLRSVAAWLNDQAAFLDPSAPVPPIPAPAPTPAPTPVPPPSVAGGINWLGFTNASPRLTVASRVGVTAAIAFEIGGSAPVQRKLTLAETSVGGDTPTYDAWITADPVNGPVIGSVAHWQYTGGALNVALPGGPVWAIRVPVGRYYFCIKQTGGADTTFYAQQN